MSKLNDKTLIMLVNHMHFGGCQKIVYDIISGVAEYFQQVYLIANEGYYSKQLQKHKNLNFIDRTSLSTSQTFFLIRDIQKQNRQVVLHTHNRFDIIFKYVLRSKHLHVHTFHSAYVDKNYLYKIMKPKFAVSISKTVMLYLKKHGIVSQIIYNGIDNVETTPVNDKSQQKETRLKYIGRVTKEKGFEYLLDAFISLKQNFKNYEYLKLDVIGNGDNVDLYKKRLVKFNYKNDVNFLGFVKNPWENITPNDLVVIPSYFEGFCLVAAEAASFGVPVIGNNISALREVLDFLSEENFFNNDDESSFQRVLIDFMKNKKKHQHIALENVARTKSRFSKPQMIAQYIDVYKAVFQ